MDSSIPFSGDDGGISIFNLELVGRVLCSLLSKIKMCESKKLLFLFVQVNGINQLLNQWRSRVQELKLMTPATRTALVRPTLLR